MLPSGYTVGQTWGGLHKAWLGYCIALYKNEGEKALLYASIIQKLQRELGIQVYRYGWICPTDIFHYIHEIIRTDLALDYIL